MRSHSYRKLIVLAIFMATALIFLIRLFYIQVIDDRYKFFASDNVLRHITVYPARGLIYDRNNELLAYNEAAYDLMVIPKQVKEMDTTEFCSLLNISREQFDKAFVKARQHSPYKSSVFEKQIEPETADLLQEKLYKFPGFYLQARTLRKYPKNIAAHVLGYVSEVDEQIVEKNKYYKSGDYIGTNGIEKAYEEVLRGKRGLKIYMVDVFNRIKGSFEGGQYDTLAISGTDIVTTLDAGLQEYGEKLMQNKKGSIVAIEPSSGEILALVTGPGYDPNLLVGRVRASNYNALWKDSLRPLFNRALMALYPPGSTFKLINALIGLEEGVLYDGTYYSCNMGFRFGGLTVGCHSHPSPLDLRRSIQHSCNAYYCNVFRSIINKYDKTETGFNRWRGHVMSFGLGQPLNTDLSEALKGNVPTAEYYNRYYGKGRWKALTVISLAIGQGELGVTPLQMANLTAAIANRGYYHIPHVVKSVGGEGKREAFKEKQYTSVSPAYFETVIDGMEDVVSKGTGWRARIDSVVVCGKTGTAQNPHGEDHSIFIAFAPREQARIAVAVYVENAGFGSTWAAPIASLMIEKYLKGSVGRVRLEKEMMEGNLIQPE